MITTYVLAAGSTWKGAAITDATDFSISETSSPTRISTDGSRSVSLIVVDQKMARITVNGINQNLLSSANYRSGSNGELVLKGKLRGAGDTTSTAITFTIAEAVLLDNGSSSPNEGNGTVNVTWEAYDSDDNNSLVAYS
jgi:hypothetical protein